MAKSQSKDKQPAKGVYKFKDPNDFKEIDNFFGDIDKKGNLMSADDKTDIRGWCSTGNYMLNAHFSGSILRGFPLGRAITIAGDPKTGKSYFAIEMIEELQMLGYFVQLYETEASPDRERFLAQKINLNMLRKTPVKTIEEVIHKMTATTHKLYQAREAGNEIPKVAYVIDSWNGLVAQKDYDDAVAGELKSDMGHFARLGKKLFNLYTIHGAELDIPLIVTCHVYEKDMKGFRMKTTSGGNGPVYFSSILAMLSKKKVNEKSTGDDGKEEKETTGIMITSKLLESRYAKTTIQEVYLDFKKGINKYFGLLPYCNWDLCGIDRGDIVNPTDFISLLLIGKKVTKDNLVGFTFTVDYLSTNLSKAAWGTNGSSVIGTLNFFVDAGFIEQDGKNYRILPKMLERFDEKGKYVKHEEKITVTGANYQKYVVRHLPGEAFTGATVHQAKVFTQEVLEKLDEVIRKDYEYGEGESPEISDTVEDDYFGMEE